MRFSLSLFNRAVEMDVSFSAVREILSVPATQIHGFRVSGAMKEGEAAIRQRSALRRVDRELERGNYKAALSLVKQLKAHPAGLLRGFGAAAPKVPRIVPYLDELKSPGKRKISSLQSLVDAILHSIKCSLEFQLKEEETGIAQPDFKKTMEEDTYSSIYEDRLMCMQHEAGHFLVGYMLGVFPRRYKVPSMEDLVQDKFARGKVEFVGLEFLRDVDFDTMSNKKNTRGRLNKEVDMAERLYIWRKSNATDTGLTLKRFSCVVLGGMAAEHLVFGYSELLHSDVSKLDRVHKWLDLTENEIHSKTREAAEAAVLIVSSQSEAQRRLAEAMALGRSVGFCIETIERTLNFSKL